MSDVSRVTQQSATILMVADLQSGLSQLTQLQEEAATGKQINQPSDNPAGTSEVLSLNAQLGRFQQYTSNISDGQSWLGTAGTALGSVITNLNQVQTDVLSGANATAAATGSSPLPGRPDDKGRAAEPGLLHVQQPAHLFRHVRDLALPPGHGERCQ
jgi:flagellar hook-associated protein 3 FlgL